MINKEFHASRRQKYGDLLKDNSMGFLFAGDLIMDRGDLEYPFTPNANFYYLTGFDQPKAILMITKIHNQIHETLFIDHPDETARRWMGVFYTKESVKEETGIETVEYLERFESSIPLFRSPDRIQHVYVDIANWGGPNETTPAQAFAKRILDYDPTLTLHNTFHALSLIRQVKTKEEIQLHWKACDITTKGVNNMLKNLRPGMYEYEIEAYFDFILKSNHARHAFTTIAASGKNACCMHYEQNDRQMKDGDMILFDLGAEWGYYASDVSRTFPVNGKFTQQQKDLYNVVLKGLNAALDATKPGQKKSELQEISKNVMAEELIKLGMIEKPEEISKYYFHGSGHYIGLYTHDVGNDNELLEEDMVFTLEPGLYFDDLNLGIRIEDTLVVTKDGYEVMSDGIPKTVEEIEAFMAR